MGLVRKGIRNLRRFGVRDTWQRVTRQVRELPTIQQISKQHLYSAEELATQREHVFPKSILFSIIVPLYNTPELFLREMIESVFAQTYAKWELCLADGSDGEHAYVENVCKAYAQDDARIHYKKLEHNLGISHNSNAAIALSTGDYIALLDHDDLLHPAALHEVMRAICELGADFVYTDENTFRHAPEDAYNPHYKPGFAPDNLRAGNYICHFTAFQRTLLDEVGPFDPSCDGSQDHDLFLRLTEKAQHVAHIPEVLYYWRAHQGSAAEDVGAKPYTIDAGCRAVQRQLDRLGLQGEVAPVRPGLTIYRVRYAIQGTPKVSILIPNREHLADLQQCLDSIFERTSYPNYEIVIVENGSMSHEIFAYYEQITKDHANVRVVTWPGDFNYSAINNYGAQYCTGDYLLLLNNDTTVISTEWIQEMLMYAQRKDVGAVGAKLLYPDNTIQHAGVGLGLLSLAGHYYRHVSKDHVGYFGRLLYAQDVTAVTGACVLLDREVWDLVGGFDETLAVDFSDIDLCLRLRKAGHLIVWTPFAELYHHESKTRTSHKTTADERRFNTERVLCQLRWRDELAAGDPYYNPNLALTDEQFSLESTVVPHSPR